METATANQRPNPVDRYRKRRSYELYGILSEKRAVELSMLNQFALVPATWTLKEYKHAIQDLVREDLAVINPNNGVIVLM